SSEIAPVYEGRNVVGVRIQHLNKNHPWAVVGLQSDDILWGLNAHRIAAPEDISWTFKELKTAAQLDFDIQREGHRRSLTVRVSP
ncbi:unnamed protein product, partial [Phaeothamnion confervicola]